METAVAAIEEKIKSNEILMKIAGSIGGSATLIPIVQSGLDMVKSKVPEIGDIIGMGGKLAALVGQFKISGSEKQEVVIQIVDIVLDFVAQKDATLADKITELRGLAKNTLPSVLTLAVSAAKGKMDFAGLKNNSTVIEGLKKAANAFLKMIRPRLLVCGLSSTVIDKADEITAPPKPAPAPAPAQEKEPGDLKETEVIPARSATPQPGSVVYDA